MRNMNRRWLLFATVLAASGAMTSCLNPSAVDDFAKVSTHAAALFPPVAAIPYNACLVVEKNRQLVARTEFDPDWNFDQARIAEVCKLARETSERLTKVYAVLTEYISTLDKLAGGNAPTFDQNIQAVAGAIPGLNSAQQQAASGLATVIADLVLKHYRQKEAAKAIHQAQPFVHTLTELLRDQLPPFFEVQLKDELDSYRSLHQGIARFRVGGTTDSTSPILVTASFAQQKAAIEQQREALKASVAIIGKMDEGHTALDKNRNKLFDKSTIQELFQTASAIKTQVEAVETAFKAGK
jgi:hypothetical protein